MARTVKIITDSAADLAPEIAAAADIDVVPLAIRFDDEEFTDGVDLTREAFWQRMETSKVLPATSAPSPGAFEAAFRKAAEDGYQQVVCLTISSKISGTYQIATSAASALTGVVDVSVVDTQACTLTEAVLCLEAARMAGDGMDAAEIVHELDSLKTRAHLYGALDTLENLKKGGRIGTAGAFFGSLLSIKPIVGLVDGEVKAVARARTRSKAIDHLVEVLKQNMPVERVLIGHAYAPDFDIYLARIKEVTGLEDVSVSIIGPVVGTHAGPRLLALSFITAK